MLDKQQCSFYDMLHAASLRRHMSCELTVYLHHHPPLPPKQPPGLLEDYPSGVDPHAECCDVRWDLKVDNRSRGTLKRTHPPCQHRTSLSSSAACRLCNSRLKLCLLVLVLLHTVASLTASHNATGLGLPAITPLEESPANEE